MGSLRLIFLIITRSVLPFGRTVGLLGRQPSDIDRPLRGLIIGFSNVILKEFGLCRSRGADPAVWIFRYETETKGDGCDQHHEANGTVKKEQRPMEEGKNEGNTHESGGARREKGKDRGDVEKWERVAYSDIYYSPERPGVWS